METVCKKCILDPTCHSFGKISEKNDIVTFYTNPTRARLYNDTEGILLHYDSFLKSVKDKNWIWIFDSNGFELKHALQVNTGIGIAKLTVKYGQHLQEIIIINPTLHIKTMLTAIWPFLNNTIRQKIKILDKTYISVPDFIR